MVYWLKKNFMRFTSGLTWSVVAVLVLGLMLSPSAGQSTGYSLRFYGNGVNDIDRVKIKIDAPAVPADIGATHMTVEFWMKAAPGANPATAGCNNPDGWIAGNIIIDRDIFGAGDYGDYGISLSQGRVAFGVSNSNTICGATNVANNAWHHIAVTRNFSTGQMRIYVDGVLDKEGQGMTGNISYRNDRPSGYPNDPYLVIGAEKHDEGPQFPSYEGWIDELRLSNSLRYTSNFTRPSAPFITDANTMALYHFDQGPGNCTGTVTDSSGASGGPSNGTCNFGGSPGGPVYSTDVPFVADTTAPLVSNVDAGPLDTLSGITWVTNEPANSQVLYGLTSGNLNLNTGIISGFITDHNVVLVGLAQNTTYFYRVVSRDPSGNLGQSAILSFQTISSADIRRTYLPYIRK